MFDPSTSSKFPLPTKLEGSSIAILGFLVPMVHPLDDFSRPLAFHGHGSSFVCELLSASSYVYTYNMSIISIGPKLDLSLHLSMYLAFVSPYPS